MTATCGSYCYYSPTLTPRGWRSTKWQVPVYCPLPPHCCPSGGIRMGPEQADDRHRGEKKIKFQRESHTAVGLFPSLNKCVRCSDSSVFDWKHKCHGQGGNILKWMFRCEMKRKFWSSRCSHGHTLHLNLVLTETLGRNLRHLWTRI